jgi:hypothetical protein
MPKPRVILENRRRIVAEDLGAHADIGQDRYAAQRPARKKQMARLLAKEGHGRIRRKRAAEIGAAVAIDSARQIDRDDPATTFANLAKRRPDVVRQGACQAGPEHGVDDNIFSSRTETPRACALQPSQRFAASSASEPARGAPNAWSATETPCSLSGCGQRHSRHRHCSPARKEHAPCAHPRTDRAASALLPRLHFP